MQRFLILLFLVFNTAVWAEKPLERFEFLVGSWQGVEGGVAGDGIGFRTYSMQLNSKFLVHHNTSTFPISKRKPRGEVHRDFGVLSYNSNDSSYVLREFHVEGFTNIYVLNKALSSEKRFVFITREIENNPGEWVARLTIKKISDDEFKEYFDIATDGKTFKSFLKNHWMREK